jgi:hypothetical protein
MRPEYLLPNGTHTENPAIAAELWQNEATRLTKLVPPETNRAEGGVGQGTWSVFAGKVVAERDAALTEIAALRAEVGRLQDALTRIMRGCADKYFVMGLAMEALRGEEA